MSQLRLFPERPVREFVTGLYLHSRRRRGFRGRRRRNSYALLVTNVGVKVTESVCVPVPRTAPAIVE